jgi:sigma-B regulation protein RsbU (phosphoserine phosphatase)
VATPPHQWRLALDSKLASIRKPIYWLRTRARRGLWHCTSGWNHLTAGIEIEELWGQFKTEAAESSRPYQQEVSGREGKRGQAWRQPFKIFKVLACSVLKKLSPPRRLFLLFTIILAVLSVIGFHFFFLTKEIEFIAAFAGLLILLILVLGDHISMKRDIEIAREIQRWLVPRRAPDVAGVDIAFATRPAKTIGGDYFDVFRRATEGPLLIIVADVSGKSVRAAMLMATFQGALRALGSASGSLAELVGGLNRQACANSQNGRFTTAFLAELDPATGSLTYLCAGHNPPILKREDGSVELLKSDNIPLGIELKEKYKTDRTRLETNDLLVIYTDGVTEARNENQDEFGEERLLVLMQSAGEERSALTLSRIMQNLDEFVGAATQHDDITCLVVRRN